MADVSADIKDWSVTASSNSPADATTVGAGLADNLQQIQATVRAALAHKGSDIVSAATTDLGAVPGFLHDITGSTGPIASFGTVSAGVWKILQFDSTPTITYNASSMILPGNVDITAAAGDHCMALSLGSGNWVIPWYVKDAAGAAPPFSDAIGIVRGSADATKILRLEVDGFTTATTRVLTAQDEDGTIALTSEFAYANVAGSSGRQVFPRMWISGLVQSVSGVDASHDTSISAGEAMDGGNTHNMILSSALIKRIDAAWAVGTNQGGLDGTESVGGTPDVSTWYYIWLIKRSDTGVVDALYSESASAPTMPANYDYKRLIGAVLTDSSANIIAYDAYETAGGGMELTWDSPTLDIDLSNTLTTSRRLDVVKVPIGFSVESFINVTINDASAAARTYITCPDTADLAPSVTATPLSSSPQSLTTSASFFNFRCRTNTAGQIAARADIATVDIYRVATLGFMWSRR